MKEFSAFLKLGDVKLHTPNLHLAASLCRESRDRLILAESMVGTQKPKYVLENAYEAVRELIDAALSIDGFKSMSHEATVAYLINLGFTYSESSSIDQLRKKRNGIKYYGEDVTIEEARDALQTAKSIIQQIISKKPSLNP